MSVKERLKEFINYKGISVRSFEAKCGFSYGYIANMRVSMQPEKVTSIAERYPELNTGWLLTGEGDMLKNYEQDSKINECRTHQTKWRTYRHTSRKEKNGCPHGKCCQMCRCKWIRIGEITYKTPKY